jgi:hypothetical protein
MQKTILMDKYPIFSYTVQKNETNYQTVDEIINYLKKSIDEHAVAVFITIFDHYKHTSDMEDGVINPEILAAKNIIFCFGKQLPSTQILAVRPRSIGVSEIKDSFIIDFLQVPNEQLQKVQVEWIKSIKNS